MRYLSPFKIHLASRALKQGRLIAYPTEAVYGLGCDPYNTKALQQLLHLKQRPIEKGLILVAAEFSQLQPFVDVDANMLARIMLSWPGPTTWVLPAQAWVPKLLKGEHNTLAVRVSAHPIIQALCRDYRGAIVSTSANISQQSPARSVLDLHQKLPYHALCIIPGHCPQKAQPTAIYDAVTGQCLRKS